MPSNKTRDTLIDTGVELLLSHGFTASGINRIVGAAKVPKGSFYHFFPGGKEAFALAVIKRYHERASADRAAHLLAPGAPPLVRLRAHFAGFADGFFAQGFRQGCLLGNLSAEIADQMPAVRAALQTAFAAWVDDVARVLAEARESGAVSADCQPDRIARTMVAAWEGALLVMKAQRSSQALDDFQRLWFDDILSA